MIHFFIRISLTTACLLMFCTTVPTNAYTQESSVADPEAYRQVLLDIVDVADSVTAQMQLSSYRNSLAKLVTDIDLLTTAQLEFITQYAPPAALLQNRIDTVQRALAEDGVSVRQIEFPEPETTIAACESISSTEGFDSLVSFYTAREILVALTFPCLESVAGENDATACTAFKVIDAALEAVNKGVQSCLQEQRDAYLDAILETEENIADHLESFVDATTSSRATQDSVDDMQSDVTSGLGLLTTLRSDLDTDLLTLEDDMDDVIDDLDNLISDAIDLASIASDIQFRVQENQVDIEDAQTRAADAQETAEEIRTDTQSIISAIETLQTDFDGFTATLSSGLEGSRQAALIAALANENTRIVRFQLPNAVGGELEQIRELVIQTLTAFNSIGLDTKASSILLTQGDIAYNQGQYLDAYRFFAEAYRTLTANDGALKSGIQR